MNIDFCNENITLNIRIKLLSIGILEMVTYANMQPLSISRGCERMGVWFLQLPRQSLPTTPEVVSRWFSPVSATNKTDLHDITELLLKVALNTINQPTKQLVVET